MEELHKKDLNDPNNHNGVVIHLELDILGSEVKWASVSIIMNKASGGDGISAELFKIVKGDAVKCCTQYASKFGKFRSSHSGHWKKSVFISIPKKHNAKEMFKLLYNCTHFTCELDYAQKPSS